MSLEQTNKPTRPVVVYVDDEPKNLTLFEIRFEDDLWDVHCFDSAVDALKEIKQLKPSVIVSDQRMPHMTGLEFLEVCSQIVPDAVRMIVTGQTDEETIIELVRRAKIFDYIVKPWQVNDLITRIQKGIDYHQAMTGQKIALAELKTMNEELERKNKALEEGQKREEKLLAELAGWAPWPIMEALKAGKLAFPFRKDIVCIVFDIVNSYRLADVMIEGKTVRAMVMNIFRELVIRSGGLNESQGGDAAYAHFGAFQTPGNHCEAALSVAREFRVRLRNLAKMHSIEVECGIAIHYVEDALIEQNTIKAFLNDDDVRVERSVSTQSNQIDLVHRLEKLTHGLPGTNILMTEDFIDKLPTKDSKLVPISAALLKGQSEPVNLYLIHSDMVKQEDLEKFKKTCEETSPKENSNSAA